MPTPRALAPRRLPPGKAVLDPIDFDNQASQPTVEVLLVAPAGNTRALFTQTFQSSNWHLESTATPADALLRLHESPMAVVIYEDQTQPPTEPDGRQEAWLGLIEQTRTLANPPKVIVASRCADDRMWAEVLHQGGYDVLPLPLEPGEVVRTVSMAWLEWRHEMEGKARGKSELGAMTVAAS